MDERNEENKVFKNDMQIIFFVLAQITLILDFHVFTAREYS
jgi:hypothetical protein